MTTAKETMRKLNQMADNYLADVQAEFDAGHATPPSEVEFEIMQCDDPTLYYVNEYSKDAQGITRRETIGDELTLEQAQALVQGHTGPSDKQKGSEQ